MCLCVFVVVDVRPIWVEVFLFKSCDEREADMLNCGLVCFFDVWPWVFCGFSPGSDGWVFSSDFGFEAPCDVNLAVVVSCT